MKNKPFAIEVHDLTFGYTKNEPVLENVSFAIEENEFIGVIGPNGGGKSTLCKLLMGFLRPWQGSIVIQEKVPTNYPNGIAYVPQNLRYDKLFPISVFEIVLQGRLSHLSFFGTYSKEDHKKALYALELVNLIEFKDVPFGTLSGGQMQRALIARALCSDPQILILDEPTANVDIEREQDVYELLLSLRKELTILMITHDIQAVIQHVSRVLCVQKHVVTFEPKHLCEHFALGLYHYPLIGASKSHFPTSDFARTNFKK